MSTPARKEPRRRIRTRQAAIVVEISNTQGFLDVHADGLARLVQRVLHDEGIDHAAISVALVDNATIRRINRIHLAHDWPTDVISFTLSGVGEPELVGELVADDRIGRIGHRGPLLDGDAKAAVVDRLRHLHEWLHHHIYGKMFPLVECSPKALFMRRRRSA